jgi:flavin-dependent dehydrogenase
MASNYREGGALRHKSPVTRRNNCARCQHLKSRPCSAPARGNKVSNMNAEVQSKTMHDVLILGGGLAGLTLAMQLKQTMPGLDVRVVERRSHPAPVAAHKIGESSVEIGAHYFSQTLGLKQHLDEAHLRKFGFRFFFSEGETDLSQVTELGASRFLTTPSWQIDRGVFENFLSDEAQRRGVCVEHNAAVRQIELDKAQGHTVEVEHLADGDRAARKESVRARWVVDAAGRASLLKRKLNLAEDNAHDANAVWFRLDTRLEIDAWVDDPVWRARCTPQARWQSTNHLCGEGYWLWLIPLGSGAHSVGIVADAKLHPLATMNTFERAMDWIRTHQPCVAEVIDKVLAEQPDALMDFAFFKNFSYGCRQVFSAERWALTGDAGLFLDPFYSPGSDFIAISNTYITELIRHDQANEPLRLPALFYGEVYQSLYQSTLALYTDQYRLFGSARVMPIKVLWDYTYYWGVLCQLFFQQRLTDRAMFNALSVPLNRARQLNTAMQNFMRHWGDATAASLGARAPNLDNPAQMLDQASLPWFAELNRSLGDARLDDAAFAARLQHNVAQLEQLAGEIVGLALRGTPALAAQAPADLVASADPELLFAPAV